MNVAAPRLVASALAALALAAAGAPARAATINYCSFESTTGINLNGSATHPLTTNYIRLAPNVIQNQRGSAFVNAPVAFPAGTSFHAFFRFRIGPNAGGADGLAFVLQSNNSNALGNNGGDLGYGGIGQSVAIEFDTYQNAWDTTANHVALLFDGDTHTHVASATPAFALANNQTTSVWIDFDGAAKLLLVFVAQGATKPAMPLLSTTADLKAHLGAQVWVGFTGSTGGSTNNQDVFDLEFSTDGYPCCATAPNGACSAPLPVCGGGGLCVQCTSAADCSAPTPKCDTTTSTCVACLKPADCGGTTPVCDPGTHSCVACASDADCAGSPATPACQPSGACGQCSATNTSKCLAPMALCDVTSGTCVGCNTNADCIGTTPVCNQATHTCKPCTADADCAGTPATPACATTGPSLGACVQCSSDAGCLSPAPKCDLQKNLCGCAADTDCGAGQVCDKVMNANGQCFTGCHVSSGVDSCGPGSMCDKQDGTVGTCQPAAMTSSSSGVASSSGMASSSGAMSSSSGMASSSGGVGGMGGAMGSGGAGGMGATGSSGVTTGATSSSGSSSTSSGVGTGGAPTGTGGAGGSGAQGGAPEGTIAVGGGCWCGVGGGGEIDPKAIAIASLLAAALAGRRRRRAITTTA
ncbi:MAG: hypothetical protein QM820_08210 [Minicystis sp.]